jgi:hypothetical protein
MADLESWKSIYTRIVDHESTLLWNRWTTLPMHQTATASAKLGLEQEVVYRR